MARDHLDELLNIEQSRAEREAQARIDRWFWTLIAADIAEAEARQIIADVQASTITERKAA